MTGIAQASRPGRLLLCVHLGIWLCTALPVMADSSQLGGRIDEYFSELKSDFDRMANDPVMKGTNLKTIDRYFVSVLKKHQVIYTIVRTNSKGMVICDVIRGEKPERRLRDISDQPWFGKMAQSQQDYEGYLKEDNGRYYVFWAKPVLKRGTFVGAVVAKVDLWDCFHDISKQVMEPYLVRLAGISLYSHKWSRNREYDEEQLAVPGVNRISVRTERTGQPSAVETSTEPATGVSAPAETKTGLLSSENKLPIIVIIVAVVVAVFILLYIVVPRIRSWMTMRKIDRSDRL